MKIMWLHSHLSFWGGGTKFIYHVIKELSKNHDIELFVEQSSENVVSKFKEIPIKVTTLSSTSTGSLKFWFNFNRQLNNEIRFLEKKSTNFDLVISSMFPMNIIANSISLPHIQYCFEPFAFFWDEFMIKHLSLFKRLFVKYLRMRFGKFDINSTQNSDRILTVNSGTQSWISKIYDRDSIPTLLGVDTDLFKKYEDNLLKNQFNNKKIIIHSTDWTPLKRTNWLLDRYIELLKTRDDLVLVVTEVLTNGIERKKFLKKIKKHNLSNVKLCGFVSSEDLPYYYSNSDVAAYVGIGQGASAASLFVLECMACETPVIRTDDTAEEVTHGQNGYLFSKNNNIQFNNLLLELLDESTNKKFGTNARDFIKNHYSWHSVSKIIEKNCFDILHLN